MVLNSQGIVVYATSRITLSVWWPTLYPDLCKLALGAGDPWDLEEYLDPSMKAPHTPSPRIGGALTHGEDAPPMTGEVCSTPSLFMSARVIPTALGRFYTNVEALLTSTVGPGGVKPLEIHAGGLPPNGTLLQ